MKHLNDEQRKIIRDAGKFRFDYKNLALLLDMPADEILKELDNPESEFSKLSKAGRAHFMLEAFRALEKKANKGDRLAAKTLMKLTNELEIRNMQDDFLGTR